MKNQSLMMGSLQDEKVFLGGPENRFLEIIKDGA